MRDSTNLFLLFILSRANRERSQDEHKQEWVWSLALTLMTSIPKLFEKCNHTLLSLHFQLLRQHFDWGLGKMYFSYNIHKDVWTVIACNLKKMFIGVKTDLLQNIKKYRSSHFHVTILSFWKLILNRPLHYVSVKWFRFL